MRTIKYLLLIIVVLIFAGLVYLYSGAYNIGTDVPHTGPVHWLLSTLRERSIETHAKGIKVPPLSDPQMITTGAHHYAHMCSGCHLAPGMPDTEIRQGLYPKPPELSEHKALPPATVYWIIKHGIKFTAMPAWGPTHDDAALWSIVAFVEKLPSLSADQYAAMVHSKNHGVGSGGVASGGVASGSAPAASGTTLAPTPAASAGAPPASSGSAMPATPSASTSASTPAAAKSASQGTSPL